MRTFFFFFFFFFFLLFTFENDWNLFWIYQKWEFSTGKNHFTPGKKSGKMTFPLRKICLLSPCLVGLFGTSCHVLAWKHNNMTSSLYVPAYIAYLHGHVLIGGIGASVWVSWNKAERLSRRLNERGRYVPTLTKLPWWNVRQASSNGISAPTTSRKLWHRDIVLLKGKIHLPFKIKI